VGQCVVVSVTPITTTRSTLLRPFRYLNKHGVKIAPGNGPKVLTSPEEVAGEELGNLSSYAIAQTDALLSLGKVLFLGHPTDAGDTVAPTETSANCSPARPWGRIGGATG
jgi:hypothetical protein